MTRKAQSAIAIFFLAAGARAGAEACPPAAGESLRVKVIDPSGRVIEGAEIKLSGPSERSAVTSQEGEFAFQCLPPGRRRLQVSAKDFSTKSIDAANKQDMTVALSLAPVKSTVDVSADAEAPEETGGGFGTVVLNQKQIGNLAGDPDDLKRQLQALAAAGGGAPGQAAISVDGFHMSSKLPPKGSIGSVRVNPDLYSAEYATPPYQGGRIEIFTKPGGSAVQGAAFFAGSPAGVNANNAFSRAPMPASRERFGFELGGPIRRNKSDYSAEFERRTIHEINVVNAFGLDASGASVAVHQNVEAPRDLWMGSARTGVQLSTKNTLSVSYQGSQMSDRNLGIGGLVLPEAGYNNTSSEHTLRLTGTTVLGANLLHQSRLGLTWKNGANTPLSAGPGIDVAGAFVGGGSTLGKARTAERSLEWSDDLSWTHREHSLKVGVTALATHLDNYEPELFNGSFVFGGGLVESSGGFQAINGLEQYRRAQMGLPGGTPTSFEAVGGDPRLKFSQWQIAMYAQDQWKVHPRLSIAYGIRYALQTSPGSFGNVAPRFGVAWSPDRKRRWVIQARLGLFYSPVDPAVSALAYRLNGLRQTQSLIYNPSYLNPLGGLGGPASVETIRRLAPGLNQSPSFQPQLALEHALPRQWHAQASISFADARNMLRSRNINAPDLTGAVTDPLLAPRPIEPGRNILQFEQSGVLRGPVLFIGLSQQSYKRGGVFVGYLYSNLRTNADTPMLAPQSSYSNAGEVARASWEPAQQAFAVGQINLFYGLNLSSEVAVSSGRPYDLLTGRDNNGDGIFNDRPSLANAPGPGVFLTPFGLLSSNGINGTIPRNLGRMPAAVHLDTNLTRTFFLHSRGERRQSVVLNLQVSNLLNHTNVTAVGNVVGSPAFGQAVAAETARRLEFGIRFTF